MKFIKWTPKISLDHPHIDQQHQKLFDLVNLLIKNIDEDKKVITEILSELKTYTELHFSEEEAILAERGYPGLEDHKFEHRFFTRRISSFYKEVVDENKGLSRKMLEFLADWISHHTLKEDLDYKKYL